MAESEINQQLEDPRRTLVLFPPALELNARLCYLVTCPSLTDTYLKAEDRVLALVMNKQNPPKRPV